MALQNAFANLALDSSLQTLVDRAAGAIPSPFSEVLSVERTPVFNLSSVYTLSARRNVITGSPTDTDEEYMLSAGQKIESAEIANYVPGYASEAGVGVRIVSLPTGSQVMQWGLYDSEDGFFYKLTASGLSVVIRRNSVDTAVAQASFNVDAAADLLLTRGNIFQIRFTWYGYGQIQFQVVDTDVTHAQRLRVLHRAAPNGATSVRNPNLPITVEVTGAGSGVLALAGRQYSILGRYAPQERTHELTRTLAGVTTTWTPLIAFRRQSTTDAKRIKVNVQGMALSTSALAQVALVVNPTLTFGTAVAPELATFAQSAVEFSVNPSSFTIGTGEAILTDLVTSAGTKQSGGKDWPGLNLPVARTQPAVMLVRAITGTVDVTGLLRALEEW